MSRLHILQGDGANNYTIVSHTPMPVGNNSAGVTWQSAYLSYKGGTPKSTMAVGTGPGQISTAENTDVTAGNVIEISFTFTDNPAWDSATRTAQLNTVANDTVTRIQNELSARLKWYGATVT